MKKVAIVALALATAAPGLAQEVENSDIPTQCVTVCANIATVSSDCDRIFDRSSDELACMCQAEYSQEIVPICAACIAFYDTDDDDDRDDNDNDVGELRRDCGFSSTTYNPSTTYPVRAMTAATSITTGASSNSASGTTSSTGGSASSRLSDLTSSAATATGSAASSISAAISSVSSAAQPTNTGNAGTMNEGGHAALAGAVLLAAAAWL